MSVAKNTIFNFDVSVHVAPLTLQSHARSSCPWTMALTERKEVEVAELKMFRVSLRVTRSGMSTSEARGTAQVGWFGEKTREARLRWYGHVPRKDDGYIGRRMLRMKCQKRGNGEGLK